MKHGALSLILIICSLKAISSKLITSCECGVGNSEEIEVRIINGSTAFPHQFPWMVYMKYWGKIYCGGAIINDRYILTAGHCVYALKAKGIQVIVGGHDAKIEDGVKEQAAKIILHENYTRHANYDDNDVALIRLERPLRFTDNIKPICLPHPDSDYTKSVAIIAGWGTTERGNMSRYLLHNTVRVITNEECQNAGKVGDKVIIKENICAYGFETDTCQGDSGSPLVYESNPYKFEVIGIVSWGDGCAPPRIPSVYVRVNNYLDWIEKHTQDANYCTVYQNN